MSGVHPAGMVMLRMIIVMGGMLSRRFFTVRVLVLCVVILRCLIMALLMPGVGVIHHVTIPFPFSMGFVTMITALTGAEMR